MKTVHRSMIQDRSSRVSTCILKPGPGRHLLASVLASIAVLLVLPIITNKAAAQLTILHSFGDGSVTNDGAHPSDGLVQAPDGDIFGGTIYQASTTSKAAGTIFKVTAAGSVKIIHRFALTSNMWPSSLLLYYKGRLLGIVSGAAVFALTNSSHGWHFSLWHTFTGAPGDGASPVGSLTLGPDGKLYGVTAYGGTNNAGTAYKIDPGTHQSSVVYNFTTSSGYWMPGAALALANDGNFYGSTQLSALGFVGSIFRLTPQGQFTAIWSMFPQTQGQLIQANNGNLYGTIPVFESHDGFLLSLGTSCCGALFHTFTGPDGINPVGALVQGPNGNLYGATTGGGAAFGGTIFEISTDGSVFKTIHSFGDGSVPNDGTSPNGSLILGQDGNLYGTTYYGGSAGLGTIFKITP
jgi:uncharacterized repeat protein (TIGR03803 family)